MFSKIDKQAEPTQGTSSVHMSIEILGAEWREVLPNLPFIGALDVAEETVERLCAHFRKIRWETQLLTDEDIRVAFAVTVVNLAYYSPDNSLTRFVCQELGFDPDDQTTWAYAIGDPVFEILHKYFGETRRSGPYRYVTPIRRQAGISAAAAAIFAHTLAKLIRRCGYSFTKVEFDDAVEALDQESAPVLDFLRSKAGYRFCQDLVRNVRNIHDGILDWETLRAAPGFRGHLVDRLRSVLEKPASLPSGPVFPKPRLILDTAACRLAVLFGDDRTVGRYRWEDGRQVQRPKYFLDAEDIGATLRGTIRPVSGDSVSWALTTWSPGVSAWVAFRPDDGALLQTKGALRPGRYIIAAPSHLVPQQDVHDEIGSLDLPGREEEYCLVDCTLEDGFAIEELGLRVEGAGLAAPVLRFADNARPLSGTANVFTGKPPDVEVVNWDSSFSERFTVVLTAAGVRQAISRPELERWRRVKLGALQPGRVSIAIEPIGYAPAGFVDAPLDLVIVDANTSVAVRSGVNGIEDDVDVAISPAEKVHVTWSQKGVRRGRAGVYVVPAPLEVVDGRAITGFDTGFEISLRIPRIRVSGSGLDCGVLWTERLREALEFEVELSSDEVGTNPDLIVDEGDKVTPVLTLPTVPKSRIVRLSTADLRDGLKNFNGAIGRLGVRLNERAGRVALASAAVADASIVERWLAGEFGEELELSLLPRDVGDLLRCLRFLHTRPIALPELEAFPKRLHGAISTLAVCSAVFDDGRSPDPDSEMPESLLAKLRWYLDARTQLEIGDPDPAHSSELHAAAPADWAEVPYERWKRTAEDTRRRLGSVSEVEAAVREWATHCRAREWHLAQQSEIGQREGGSILTDGAGHYHWALEYVSKGNLPKARLKLRTARDCFVTAANQAAGDNLRALARILELLCFIHWDHPDAVAAVRESIGALSPRWGTAAAQLADAVGLERSPVAACGGVRVSDLSPHPLDEQLLERGHG